jgi:hypothetical protein
MSLLTGTPAGSVIEQDELYLEGAPYIYLQDYRANPLFNPDAQGYYWGMSGTATYGVYNLGCVESVTLTEGVTMNDVMCDAVGVKDTVQRRDYVELDLTISSLFPLSATSILLNVSQAESVAGEESVGIGGINNQRRYMVYMPKVYDADSADWLVMHLHKAKLVDAWTINMTGGEAWNLTGVKIRAYADTTKPDSQRFGVIKRFDATIT